MSEYSSVSSEMEDRPSYIYPDELFDPIWETPEAPAELCVMSVGDYEYRRSYGKLTSETGLLSVKQERELSSMVLAGRQAVQNLQQFEEYDPDADHWRTQIEAGQSARDKLVVSNLHLAAWFVRETMDFRKQERLESGEPGHKGVIVRELSSLSGGELSYDDRLQIATLGLIKAAGRHDAIRGRFSTYAMWHMEGELLRAMFKLQSPLALASNASDDLRTIKKAYRKFEDLGIYQPDYEDLADELSWTNEKVAFFDDLLYAVQPVSYEQIEDYWQTARDEEAVLTDEEIISLADTLPDSGVDKSLFDEVALGELGRMLDDVIATLPSREQLITEVRFGFESEEGATFEEIGAMLGLTRERIRQLYLRALALLEKNYVEKLIDFKINEDPSMGLRTEAPLTQAYDAVLGIKRAKNSNYSGPGRFFGHEYPIGLTSMPARRKYSLQEFDEMQSQAQSS